MYIKKSIHSQSMAVTESGDVENHIYNGVVDWTYEGALT